MLSITTKIVSRLAPILPDSISIAGDSANIASAAAYAAAAVGLITIDTIKEIVKTKNADAILDKCLAELTVQRTGKENSVKRIMGFTELKLTNEQIAEHIANISETDPMRMHLEFYLMMRQIKGEIETQQLSSELACEYLGERISKIADCIKSTKDAIIALSESVTAIFESYDFQDRSTNNQFREIATLFEKLKEKDADRFRANNLFKIDTEEIGSRKLFSPIKKILVETYLHELHSDEKEMIGAEDEERVRSKVHWLFEMAAEKLLRNALSNVDEIRNRRLSSSLVTDLNSTAFVLERISKLPPLNIHFGSNFERNIQDIISKNIGEYNTFTTRLVVYLMREITFFIERLPRLNSKNSVNAICNGPAIFQLIEKIVEQKSDKETIRLVSSSKTEKSELFSVTKDYLKAVETTLDVVEMLGIEFADKKFTRYQLSTSYIRLVLAHSEQEVHTEREFREHKIIALRGRAGSGKTTLLKWIAVNCARGSFQDLELSSFNGLIPIFIKLKEFQDKPFSQIADIALRSVNFATQTPRYDFEKWMLEMLKAGNVILLCDGLDEISQTKRYEFENWLQSVFHQVEANIRVVISGRPNAIDAGTFESSVNTRKGGYFSTDRISSQMKMRDGTKAIISKEDQSYELDSLRSFQEQNKGSGANAFSLAKFRILDILPMSKTAVDAFIENWHESCANNILDQSEASNIRALSKPLQEYLDSNISLRELVTIPLICAMVCYLHKIAYLNVLRSQDDHDRLKTTQIVMPSTRKDIFEKCAAALSFQRDRESGISDIGLPNLSGEQRLKLLEVIGKWIFENRKNINHEQIRNLIDQEKQKFKENDRRVDTFKCIQLISDRGLLQNVDEDQYEFIHKSFTEYFCARSIVQLDELGKLLYHCSDPGWEEVIILATCLAGEAAANRLILELIDRAEQQEEPLRILLLAVACKDGAISVSPQTVELLTRKIGKFLPPRSIGTANKIARIGEPVIPRLAFKSDFNKSERLACIRALGLIGGPNALKYLEPYATFSKKTKDENLELLKCVERNPDYVDKINRYITIEVRSEPSGIRGSKANVNIPDVAGRSVSSSDVIRANRISFLRDNSMRHIEVLSCSNESSLEFLEGLCPKITSASFYNCWKLYDLSQLLEFQLLESLVFFDARALQLCSVIADLIHLRNLKITDCGNLLDIRPLQYMKYCNIELVGISPDCFVPKGFERTREGLIKRSH